MIDKLLEDLCFEISSSECSGLGEITKIVERKGITQKECKELIDFFEKYFMEPIENKKTVRLSSWAYNLFQIPNSRF